MNRSRTTELISLVFILSGAAAVLFETLWFRQAGLTLGNSVWTSSLVLAGFMGGLGLGNLVVARIGHRVRRVVRTYAIIELTIAATGIVLVLILPQLTGLFTPLYHAFEDSPALLNGTRLLSAFALMLIPSTAMGATLPLLVSALHRVDPNFGTILGRLYGMNTIGAVLGALLGEMLLIEWLGITGTALVAGGLNLVAAALALTLRELDEAEADRTRSDTRLPPKVIGLAFASLMCGGILLGLETVWFRILNLFGPSTSLAFALMLSVVLAGIGAGGLIAGRALSRWPAAPKALPMLALGAGSTTLLGYFAMVPIAQKFPAWSDPGMVVASGLVLMFSTSFLSGVMFTLIGTALDEERGEDVIGSAGVLVFANTIGAMFGPLIAGFLMLPYLGMELSIQIFAWAYLVVAIVCIAVGGVARPIVASVLLAILMLVTFAVDGVMEERFIDLRMNRQGARLVKWVESITGTLAYVERQRFGVPLDHRLITNSHSMSGTLYAGRRYMKLFVYLPVAMHPKIENALLISYGVGSTAKALTDTPEIEHIDIVDVSEDTLKLNDLVFTDPATHPLNDPRVQVHIEDGRYFLEVTKRTYDLITGEPPPPKNAGIVSLYTSEFFELAHERLNPGGFLTYWLPVHDLDEGEARAIIAAFCDVFDNCTLWNGWGPDWILIGQRDGGVQVSEARYNAQWNPPRDEIVALGIERPEQLGALFIADAKRLGEWTDGVAPVVDNYPLRLHGGAPLEDSDDVFFAWLDPERSRADFEKSPQIEAWVPEAARRAALPYFRWQHAISRRELGQYKTADSRLPDAEALLTQTELEMAPLVVMGTNADVVRAATSPDARATDEASRVRGLSLLAQRDYAAAAELLREGKADDDAAFADCLARGTPGCASAAPGQ